MEFTYEITPKNNVNLSKYTFVEQEQDTEIHSVPECSPLVHSTRTVTAMLYQDNVDYSEWISLLTTKYPEIVGSINLLELKWIILNRLVKDAIDPDIYFPELIKKCKGNYSRLIASNILLKISKNHFLNIYEIYDNITLKIDYKEFYISSVVIRDFPIKTISNYSTIKRGFRNQITLRINKIEENKIRNVNVMIFQNGKLTITGCRNNDEIIEIIKFCIKTIQNLIEGGASSVLKDTTKPLEWCDIQCHSMNYHYSLNFNMDNNNLYKLLNDKYKNLFDIIDFNQEQFSGLKFRFKEDKQLGFKGALVIVFLTGSINIYRSSSEEEVKNVYKTINGIVKENYSILRRR